MGAACFERLELVRVVAVHTPRSPKTSKATAVYVQSGST
jgi:hypothetical protein